MDTLCVSNAETWVACGRCYGIAHRPQGCVWPFEMACVKVQPGILALLKYSRSCSEEMKKQQQQQKHTSKQKKQAKNNNNKISNGEKENRQLLLIVTHRLFHQP